MMLDHSPMKPHIQAQLKTKQKIEKDKETVRPTVINDELIQEYMIQYNRENKIFDDDERQIWELAHLSLSFKSKCAIRRTLFDRFNLTLTSFHLLSL